MSADAWETVRQAFLDNAREVSLRYREEIERWNPIKADGKDFIPGYIPYIGDDYFNPRTEGRRILAYALSQNLDEKASYARDWARDWKEGDGNSALDRQNRSYQQNGGAAMHPFDTGHVPILASLLRAQVSGRNPGDDESIYPEIAATNLSKFSFRSSDKRLTIDSLSSLRQCWDWFSRLEVAMLRPDYIICCDSRIYEIVREQASPQPAGGTRTPTVIRVAFPNIRVINRHYRKPLREEHLQPTGLKERVSAVDRSRKLYNGRTIAEIIDRDNYYFAEMFARMVSQCREGRN